MEYSELCGEKVSRLGFGCMRYPLLENGEIDEDQVYKMVEYAISNGVNYFDTAYPYHGGKSELVIGRALKKYDRSKFIIADKYPGHQLASEYNPEATFKEQLEKCQVDYFDFYLLHNVYEASYDIYTDESKGFLKYFIEQKKKGLIKHLGFSTHADLPTLIKFLNKYGDDLDFCQIQLNYLDWTMQRGKEKIELLRSKNLPVVVMEPLRGGKLCTFDEENMKTINALRPGSTPSQWSFNFLRTIADVKTILSGMSSYEQVVQNIDTFNKTEPLTESETEEVLKIAETLKKGVPCTECRYCTSGCVMKLDIPFLIRQYNDLLFDARFTVSMKMESLPDYKLPKACIGCHKCELICPQKINISEVMEKLAEMYEKMPKWKDICREREEACRNAK